MHVRDWVLLCRFLTRSAAGRFGVHRFACKPEKTCTIFVQVQRLCTVLRAVFNIMYCFTCRIGKICTVLRATLKKSVHRFASQYEVRAPFCMQVELTSTVLRAVSNDVHNFACKVGKTFIVLRETLQRRRASFCMQARGMCTVLRASWNNCNYHLSKLQSPCHQNCNLN